MAKHVGRPTNIEVKAEKTRKALMIIVPVVTIAFIALIMSGSLDGLMGNSVTSYYCENKGYKLSGEKCIRIVKSGTYKLGDVNADGKINLFDATSIQMYVADTGKLGDVELKLADVNENGVVDNSDTVLIQRYLAGKKDIMGDVNLDGKITEEDATLIQKSLADLKKLNNAQLGLADVDRNGSVNIGDATIIRRYVEGLEKNYKKNINIGKTVLCKKNVGLIGDVDLNGEVEIVDVTYIQRHVEKVQTLSDDKLKLADVNENGIVDNSDAILIQRYLAGKKDIMGDVDLDGKVTDEDATLVQKSLAGAKDLTLVQYGLADVDRNGSVNIADATIIRRYVAGLEKNYRKDINIKGLKQYKTDNVISGNACLSKKIKNAKKASSSQKKYKCPSGYSLQNNYCIKDTAISSYLIGDVDKNGKIEVVDATLIQRYAQKITSLDEFQLKLADVDNNGIVQENDAKLIQEYLSGISTSAVSGTAGRGYSAHNLGVDTICPSEYTLSKNMCIKSEKILAKEA